VILLNWAEKKAIWALRRNSKRQEYPCAGHRHNKTYQERAYKYLRIDHIEGKTIYFSEGKQEDFDAIVAGIGYYRDYAEIIDVDKSRFEDLKVSVNKQKYFGKDGLYFCGFWIGATGQIREIASDAQKIAKDIAKKSFSKTHKDEAVPGI